MARQHEPIPMRYEPLHKPQPESTSSRSSSSTSQAGKEQPQQSSSRGSSRRRHARRRGSSSPSSDRETKLPQEENSCGQNRPREEWFLHPAGRRRQNAIVSKTILTGSLLNSHLKGASWKDKMSFQLLRKASLVYMTKGRIELTENK